MLYDGIYSFQWRGLRNFDTKALPLLSWHVICICKAQTH